MKLYFDSSYENEKIWMNVQKKFKNVGKKVWLTLEVQTITDNMGFP